MTSLFDCWAGLMKRATRNELTIKPGHNHKKVIKFFVAKPIIEKDAKAVVNSL
jgi:hypothetical protein